MKIDDILSVVYQVILNSIPTVTKMIHIGGGMEGWYQVELAKQFSTLGNVKVEREASYSESFGICEDDYKETTIEGRNPSCDFKLTNENGPLWIELKVLLKTDGAAHMVELYSRDIDRLKTMLPDAVGKLALFISPYELDDFMQGVSKSKEVDIKRKFITHSEGTLYLYYCGNIIP